MLFLYYYFSETYHQPCENYDLKIKILALLGVSNYDYLQTCYRAEWARLILHTFVIWS